MRKKKFTSPATNQGCHGVFTESFIVSIDAMVDVTGTLPSVSPLHFTKIIYKSQSTNSIDQKEHVSSNYHVF